MKTAAQFFAEYFECEVREAKECHHMTLECMEAFARKKCKEQRDICAGELPDVPGIDRDLILNAPQPEGL